MNNNKSSKLNKLYKFSLIFVLIFAFAIAIFGCSMLLNRKNKLDAAPNVVKVTYNGTSVNFSSLSSAQNYVNGISNSNGNIFISLLNNTVGNLTFAQNGNTITISSSGSGAYSLNGTITNQGNLLNINRLNFAEYIGNSTSKANFKNGQVNNVEINDNSVFVATSGQITKIVATGRSTKTMIGEDIEISRIELNELAQVYVETDISHNVYISFDNVFAYMRPENSFVKISQSADFETVVDKISFTSEFSSYEILADDINRVIYIKPVYFEVSYNANGGNVTPANQMFLPGDTYNLPTPEREEYSFVGWFTEQTGGVQIVNNSIISNYANHTLYAQWELEVFNIIYMLNGGTHYFGEKLLSGWAETYTKSSSTQNLNIGWASKVGYTINTLISSQGTVTNNHTSNEILTIPANTYGNITITWTWSASSKAVLSQTWNTTLGATATSITSITSAVSQASIPDGATDVSASGYTNTVYAKLASGTLTFYTTASKIYLPANCQYIFGSGTNSSLSRMTNLTSISLTNFDSSDVTSMNAMFSGCSSLASLDLSSFNTSSVTNMSCMFGDLMGSCSSLTSIDLSSFNTSNVTDMTMMFRGCSSLLSLNLSNFNTENVTSMSGMFAGCSSLTSLDLSNFNTSRIAYMNEMFKDCTSLETLNISSFTVGSSCNVTDMLSGCSSLKKIYCPATYSQATSATIYDGSVNFYDITKVDTTARTALSSATNGKTIVRGYTITYNTDGGTQQGTYDSVYLWSTGTAAIGYATKTGNTPASVTANVAGSSISGGLTSDGTLSIPANTYGDITITWTWTEIGYVITYNSNFGTVVTETQNVAGMQTFTTYSSNLFERVGYSLVSWNTSQDETGQKYELDTQYTYDLNDDLTLYAIWEIKKFDIQFSVNNSNYGSLNVYSLTEIEYGTEIVIYENTLTINTTTIEATAIQIEGYTTTFAGWFGCASSVDQNLNIVANFERNGAQYIVTFNTNGGDATDPISIDVVFGNSYGNLPSTSKNGYEFDGWYTEDISGTKIDSTSVVNTPSNHTLFAHWNILAYTISFDSNGGSAVEQLQYNIEDQIIMVNSPEYDIYHEFDGWKVTSADGNWELNSVYYPNEILQGKFGNAVLTAQWNVQDAVTYTVKHFKMQVDGTYPLQATEEYNYQVPQNTVVTPEVKSYTGFISEEEKTVTIQTDGQIIEYHYERYQYQITWLNDDGTELKSTYAYFEAIPSYGSVNPEKSSTAQYEYEFIGWTPTIAQATQNAEYTATYSSTVKQYDFTLNLSKTLLNNAEFNLIIGGDNVFISGAENQKIIKFDYGTILTPIVELSQTIYNYNLAFDPTSIDNIIKTNIEGNAISVQSDTEITLYVTQIFTINVVESAENQGGIVNPSNVNVLYNSISTQQFLATANNGYRFIGWTNPENSFNITDSNSNQTGISNITKDGTLVANFQVIQYKITTDIDGEVQIINYTVNDEDITLATPEIEGKNFIGWEENGIDGLQKEVTISHGSTGDKYYTAKFSDETSVNIVVIVIIASAGAVILVTTLSTVLIIKNKKKSRRKRYINLIRK